MSDSGNPDDVTVSEGFHFLNPSLNNQNIFVLKGITFNNASLQVEDNNNISIDKCIFKNCTTALSFQWGFRGEISNSTFCFNGYGISDYDGEYGGSRGTVANCLFYSNVHALSVNGVSLKNCTFEGNQVVSDSWLQGNTFTNCILWGNDSTLSGNEPSVFYYCDSQQQVNGDHNFSAIPRFTNSEEGDYHLLWDEMGPSPCIDTGDPNTATDLDGTLPDIGCYYYPHYYWRYFDQPNPIEHNIYWLSFPVVDDRTFNMDENQYWNELGYMFQYNMGIPPNSPLNQVTWRYYGETPIMSYNEYLGNWQNTTYRALQPMGYKVQFNPTMTIVPVVVNGFKADACITPVQWMVEAEDENNQMQIFRNCIGYFVPYDRTPFYRPVSNGQLALTL